MNLFAYVMHFRRVSTLANEFLGCWLFFFVEIIRPEVRAQVETVSAKYPHVLQSFMTVLWEYMTGDNW